MMYLHKERDKGECMTKIRKLMKSNMLSKILFKTMIIVYLLFICGSYLSFPTSAYFTKTKVVETSLLMAHNFSSDATVDKNLSESVNSQKEFKTSDDQLKEITNQKSEKNNSNQSHKDNEEQSNNDNLEKE